MSQIEDTIAAHEAADWNARENEHKSTTLFDRHPNTRVSRRNATALPL